MGMLTKDDLKQIGEVMDGRLDERFGEVLEVVNKGFTGVQEQITGLKQEVSGIKGEIVGIKSEIVGIKSEIVGIKATMVTKDYLDEKLGALKGDLIAYDRKLEHKTDTLIDTLVDRRTLTAPDLERLEQARVFPRVVR